MELGKGDENDEFIWVRGRGKASKPECVVLDLCFFFKQRGICDGLGEHWTQELWNYISLVN